MHLNPGLKYVKYTKRKQISQTLFNRQFMQEDVGMCRRFYKM